VGGKITISAFGTRSGRTAVLMDCLPRTSIEWWQRQYHCNRRTSGNSGGTVTLTGSDRRDQRAARRWKQSEGAQKIGFVSRKRRRFSLLLLWRLPKPNAGSATVLVNELDAQRRTSRQHEFEVSPSRKAAIVP
jgi:hypothetical protein